MTGGVPFTGGEKESLVKQLASVEYSWFCATFGLDTEALPFDEEDPNADPRPEPDETTAGIVAFYGRARAAADRAIVDHGRDRRLPPPLSTRLVEQAARRTS